MNLVRIGKIEEANILTVTPCPTKLYGLEWKIGSPSKSDFTHTYNNRKEQAEEQQHSKMIPRARTSSESSSQELSSRASTSPSDTATVLHQPLARSAPKRLNTERKFLVVCHDEDPPMLSAARDQPQESLGLADFLESFTNMCVQGCVISPPEHNKKVARGTTRRVYPVERFADYPALNATRLIQLRRASVRHKLFRPVSEDDGSSIF